MSASENMNVKAVLFDMDGVLVESIDAWWNTYNRVCRSQGKPEVSYEDFAYRLFGGSINEDLKYFTEVSREELSKMYQEFFLDYIDDVSFIPEARETVDCLKRRGIKTAVVTNSPKETGHLILEHVGLKEHLDVIMTGGDVSEGKPSPEIILKACKILNVKPEEAVLVGDTENDVKSGRAAGCKVIGVGVDGGDKRIEKVSELKRILCD